MWSNMVGWLGSVCRPRVFKRECSSWVPEIREFQAIFAYFCPYFHKIKQIVWQRRGYASPLIVSSLLRVISFSALTDWSQRQIYDFRLQKAWKKIIAQSIVRNFFVVSKIVRFFPNFKQFTWGLPSPCWIPITWQLTWGLPFPCWIPITCHLKFALYLEASLVLFSGLKCIYFTIISSVGMVAEAHTIYCIVISKLHLLCNKIWWY